MIDSKILAKDILEIAKRTKAVNEEECRRTGDTGLTLGECINIYVCNICNEVSRLIPRADFENFLDNFVNSWTYFPDYPKLEEECPTCRRKKDVGQKCWCCGC